MNNNLFKVKSINGFFIQVELLKALTPIVNRLSTIPLSCQAYKSLNLTVHK